MGKGARNPGYRGPLAVFAAAFIATAAMLAFSGDDATDTAAPVRDGSSEVRDGSAGIVRARGRGLATPTVQLPAPEPTAQLLAIREQAEEEVRERIGDEEADSPEGEDALDEIIGLVEGGESLQDAIDEVIGDRDSPPVVGR